MGLKEGRIEWIDIYKGIAIILVVLGHATGLFNAYIYQFHVAAFFFISGWVAKYDDSSLLKDTYMKFVTLVIPLFTMVILFGVVLQILDFCGIYKYFFDEGTETTIGVLVSNFLKCGAMINLLGAAWFVVVLFFASILSHILYLFSFRNKYVFIVISAIVYVLGYFKMKSSYSLTYSADIALVAQGYYGMGFILKSTMPNISLKRNKKGVEIAVILLLGTSFAMYLMNRFLNGANLMDIASHQMNSLGWTFLSIVNGITWLYAVSQIIEIIKVDFITKGLVEIGRSTMGIMMLHFSFFRIVAAVLFVLGFAEVTEMKRLVPSTEVGNKFWILYVFVAIVGAYFVWKWITKIPVLKQLLGADRRFINAFLQTKPMQDISTVYLKIAKSIEAGLKIKVEKKGKVTFAAFIMALLLFFSIRFIPSINMQTGNDVSETNVISGPVQITFPYEGNEVEFDEGWLEQTDEESYRWVRKESSFSISLSDQESVRFSGYVPAGIEVSHVSLFLNNILIAESDIMGEQQLILEGIIKEEIIEGNNIFRMVFDGERVPTKSDADQRVFSAMFTSIDIQ